MTEDELIKNIQVQKIEINLDMIFDRLFDRLRWPKNYPWGQPTIEAIQENGNKFQDFFHNDGYIDPEKCLKIYEEGNTLILSNIGGFNRDTRTIQNYLNIFFGKDINCNFYFGNGKKSVSFEKHHHDYQVIVKNIFGRSKWIIAGEESILENQNVFYLDKFVDHQVIEIYEPKLSMTCNLC
jgi:hypothetical protein